MALVCGGAVLLSFETFSSFFLSLVGADTSAGVLAQGQAYLAVRAAAAPAVLVAAVCKPGADLSSSKCLHDMSKHKTHMTRNQRF